MPKLALAMPQQLLPGSDLDQGRGAPALCFFDANSDFSWLEVTSLRKEC